MELKQGMKEQLTDGWQKLKIVSQLSKLKVK